MAVFRKLKRSRAITLQLMACFAFIMLAIYGWGLPVSEALYYLLVLIISLAVVIGLAVGGGYLLSKLMHGKRDD